jgi:hypothetical protein
MEFNIQNFADDLSNVKKHLVSYLSMKKEKKGEKIDFLLFKDNS